MQNYDHELAVRKAAAYMEREERWRKEKIPKIFEIQRRDLLPAAPRIENV